MALNFPNSPTNGQLYTDTMSGNSWTWDSANTCWKSTSTYIQTITVASSAPGTPAVGQLWWNQDYGRLLVYYNDGTSSQWVDASPSDYTSGLAYGQANTVFGVANAAFGKANTALQNTSGTFAGDLGVTGAVYAGGSSYSSTNNSISLNNGRIMLTKNDDWGMEMAGANGIRVRFYSSSGGQGTTVGSVQVDGTSAYYYTGNLYVYRQGIKFPATQESSADANILDDYEEGTWTPTITQQSSNPTGITYNRQQGNYVKIGTLVVASFNLYITAITNGSGVVRIASFPFACENVSEASRSGMTVNYCSGFTSTNSPTGCIFVNGATYIDLTTLNSADGRDGRSTYVTNTGTSVNLYATVIYRTAS